jgi:glucuronoxylan 4-O-methyltransferase
MDWSLFIKLALFKLKHRGSQLWIKELMLIAKAIRHYPRCRLLVFGLGWDTLLWTDVNKNGRTFFLEDNKCWFEKITQLAPHAEAYLIDYPHNITQWKTLLDKPRELELKLPGEVTRTSWDVIVVDAPAGHRVVEEEAGRMSSIYMASKLIKKGGAVFVHDCTRALERAYAERYLGEENFICEIKGRALLRQYRRS